MTYHINPETGRPNICRASIRECRYGPSSQHFESKQEATSFAEKSLTEEFGTVKTLTKMSESSQTSTKDTSVSLEKQLGVLSKEKLHALVKKRLRLAMTPREMERHLEQEGGYETASFYAFFTGNQEVSLDYNHPDTVRTFTKGACAMLASELNRVTGLPLVVFTHDKENSSSWGGHAVLKLPNGEYFDITGPASRNSFNSTFPGFNTWSEDEVTPDEFHRIMGVEEGTGATDSLKPLEKAALAKICLDLIKDYSLNDPERAGEMRF